jgi:hypothetical protein
MTVEELDKMYKGKLVELIGASYGWGSTSVGDKLTVSHVDMSGNLCLIDVRWDYGTLVFAPKDVKIVDGKIGIVSNEKVERYIEFFSKRTQLWVGKREQLINDIKTHENALYTIAEEMSSVNTLIKSAIGKQSSMDRQKIYNLFEGIKLKYSDIRFAGCAIIATTSPIKMVFKDNNDKTVEVDMGVYEITLDITKGMTFAHVEGGYKRDCSEIHPHIPSNGKPCWGTWSKDICKCHGEQDYIGELRLAHEFLSTCDSGGWYISGYAFAKDNGDRCRDCWELDYVCDCDRCSNCDRPTDDCACHVCPDTDERFSDDSYCNGCSSYTEDGCNY